ncbi:hypothetical protein FJZ26_04170 [Candidatus Parvarchaeota archaeon]|nr:hypothetical protein [Candidatus Parvarchaeota archaeon]
MNTSSSEIAKIDGKGRLLVPQAFREVLSIKDGSHVLVSVNSEKKYLTILPFAAAGDDLHIVHVTLSDAPGSLMRVLTVLARQGVDLIQSESLSSDRGRVATWKALVDLSSCKAKPTQLRAILIREKAAKNAAIEKV